MLLRRKKKKAAFLAATIVPQIDSLIGLVFFLWPRIKYPTVCYFLIEKFSLLASCSWCVWIRMRKEVFSSLA